MPWVPWVSWVSWVPWVPWGFLFEGRKRQWHWVERTAFPSTLQGAGATVGQSCSLSGVKGQAFVPVPRLRGSPYITTLGRPGQGSVEASRGMAGSHEALTAEQ